MSVKSLETSRPPDPRAVRTRDRLGDALLQLLLTKPFEEITVQEVLTRARVSRSTFYEHYRDKNDLFLSDVDQFFASISTLLARKGDRSGRLAPVAEFAAHLAQSQDLYAALIQSGKMADVRELGEAHFARGIETRLAQSPRHGGPSAQSRGAQAHALAGSLFALLNWWVRRGMEPAPAELDRLYHELAAGGGGAKPSG